MLYKQILTTLTLAGFLMTGAGTTALGQGTNAAPTQGSEAKQEAAKETEEAPEMDEASTVDKASFLIGFNAVKQFEQQKLGINFEKFLAGLNAARDGREHEMTREEERAVMVAFQKLNTERRNAERDALAKKNETEGETAMAEFAKQPGAKKLEDGVMYMVMKEGTGEKPEAADRVKLHYTGTYLDGEKFDSSVDRGKPITNGVMQFVPGFTAALKAMPVGSKWKVMIAGSKAYGMRPRPPMEVNKTLVFEIELLEIADIE